MLIVLLDGCQNANVNGWRLHQGLVMIINSVKESSDMRSLRPRPVAQDWFRAFRSMISSAHGAVDGILTRSLDARVTRNSQMSQKALVWFKMIWSVTKPSPVQYVVNGIMKEIVLQMCSMFLGYHGKRYLEALGDASSVGCNARGYARCLFVWLQNM